MAAKTFEQAVYEALLVIAETGAFPEVTFDAAAGSEVFPRMVVSETNLIRPIGFEASAVQITMAEAREKMEADRARVMQTVRWEIHLMFNRRIAPERFVESFTRTVKATADYRQFDLVLTDVEVNHPPRNEPSEGTFLVLTAEAQPSPVSTV